MIPGESRPPKVGMISLGCAKNLVDAEIMLGGARAGGFEVTADAEEADVIVVNTCGFIESAKQESIEAILEARRRPEQKLVVSGCLAQRYREELARELPEVDAFIGLDQVATASDTFRNVVRSSVLGSVGHKPRAPHMCSPTISPRHLEQRPQLNSEFPKPQHTCSASK
jgi:ribosomal protein S12 methylthiotransferase